MKKKLLALFLAAVMVLGINACAAPGSAAGKNGQTPGDFTKLAMTYLTYIGKNLKDRDIVADGAKAPKGSAHIATRKWIISELKNAGYKPEQIAKKEFLFQEKGKHFTGKNIVVKIPGTNSDHTVIAGAHYDGSGLGDNGSGLALLLATAVSMAGETLPYDTVFIFFDAEENGLIGSQAYVSTMHLKNIRNTLYMVNLDSLVFGDYCNLYGGVQNNLKRKVTKTDAYNLAMKKAAALGMKTYPTKKLDGYYAKHNAGPPVDENAVYTNPWTYDNPAPKNADYMSPSTGDWGDHAPFKAAGIPYVYMEATNWYAKGDGGGDAYTGYFETLDRSLGENGMFMNTKYDTLKNLNKLFPGRAEAHFHVFSPILTSLLRNPDSRAPSAR